MASASASAFEFWLDIADAEAAKAAAASIAATPVKAVATSAKAAATSVKKPITCGDCGVAGHRANNRKKCLYTPILDDCLKRLRQAMEADEAINGPDSKSQKSILTLFHDENKALKAKFKAAAR
jgi:hypothetical protein